MLSVIMAGRHRVPAERTLSSGLGRVSALLLLTAAPLGYVGTAVAADGSSGPAPERRAQVEDSDHDGDSRDGDSDRKSDRDSRDDDSDDDGDDSEDRDSGGRHRASHDSDGRHRASHDSDGSDDDADSDDSDDDTTRGSHTRSVAASQSTGRTRNAGASTARGDADRTARATDSTVRRSTTGATRRSGTAERAAIATRSSATTEQAATGRNQEARWDRLAQCESHQRWGANTGNGYRGGLQFSDSTWRAYGGGQYAPSAHQATREQQIAVGEKVRRDQGWSAWPACSRQLGYA
jgi:hypothetical protein